MTELQSLLAVLGWSQAKRQVVIAFLIYDRQAIDGVWSKPFLPAGDGGVIPVLTPLVCPNLLRTTELWLSDAAGEGFFTRRGAEAEARLQNEIAEALRERSWRGSAMVLRARWEPKIDGVRRDIDLVVRLGTTVFIGEMKLKKYPVLTAEIGRHILEFEHAARQLDIRRAWLAAQKPLLAQKTGFDGDPRTLMIEGFIVSGAGFGSGTEAGGYPVIDRDALTFFFQNDAFLLGAQARRENGYVGEVKDPALRLPLVSGDPDAALLAYLSYPLHVRLAEQALTIGTRRNVLHATGQTMEWPEPYLDSARLGSGQATELAKILHATWTVKQAEASRRLAAVRAGR